MFLGNLSTANEHSARKKSGKKKSSNSAESTLDSSLQRHKNLTSPIIYTAELDQIPRDVVLEFLRTCSQMMLHDENIDEIIADSFIRRDGLQNAAVEFQRDVLENNFQIERGFGCKYLSQLESRHENDAELIGAGKDFMYTAMKSYLKALKARKAKHYKVINTVPMNRVQILEFFEGCNAMMAMTETKEELKSIFKSTNKLPNQRVIDMQHGILTMLGYEPSFAVSCLNKISQDFGSDREILTKMQYFAMCAQVACREATLTDEQRAEFYAPIPVMMHHFPHIFFMQQEMMRQQHMMQQQQPAASDKMQDIESLKKSGLLALLSSPDGREKMQELAQKVQTSKQRIEQELTGWSEAQRKEYFEAFADKPAMAKLRDCGADPVDKISSFISMTDEELDEMTRLMLVISQDSQGSFLQQLRGAGGDSERFAAMNNVFTTVGSLSKFKKPTPGAHPMSMMGGHPGQGHGHAHAHGHSCPVHRAGHSAAPPDVSTGKADTMDR